MRSTRFEPPFAAAMLCAILSSCAVSEPSTRLGTTRSSADQPGTAQFRTVLEFDRSNGCNPYAGVTVYRGDLYGTTLCGGRFQNGEVYRLNTDGTIRIIHSFERDGRYPYGAVYVGGDELFGTTSAGGRPGKGTVYSLDAKGRELWTYTFKGGRDGSVPLAGLADVNGTFYGTTFLGGRGTACLSTNRGCGTVFKISSAGKESVVYSFQGGSDGSHPSAGLIEVDGKLYGTTSQGGLYDNGTLFSITTSGKERVVHSFAGCCLDGGTPSGTLIFSNGLLYGTTGSGGYNNLGTVFGMSVTGDEHLIYEFGKGVSFDGVTPGGGVFSYRGKLYGTTTQGGTNGHGTVFELTLSGDEKVLYSFQGTSDGSTPESQLTVLHGVLYGTTCTGGDPSYGYGAGCSYGSYGGYGTVFAITP